MFTGVSPSSLLSSLEGGCRSDMVPSPALDGALCPWTVRHIGHTNLFKQHFHWWLVAGAERSDGAISDVSYTSEVFWPLTRWHFAKGVREQCDSTGRCSSQHVLNLLALASWCGCRYVGVCGTPYAHHSTMCACLPKDCSERLTTTFAGMTCQVKELLDACLLQHALSRTALTRPGMVVFSLPGSAKDG